MQLCSKPRGPRGIESETFRKRGQLLSCPPTTGPMCASIVTHTPSEVLPAASDRVWTGCAWEGTPHAYLAQRSWTLADADAELNKVGQVLRWSAEACIKCATLQDPFATIKASTCGCC